MCGGFILFVLFLLSWPEAEGARSSWLKLKQSSSCGTLQVIPGDERTITPWTAAIFKVSRSPSGRAVRRFYTNGLVIGPTSIVSLAGGPFGVTLRGSKNREYRVPPAENFILGTGINSTDADPNDGIAQFSEVAFIEPSRLRGDDNEFYHVYMYHLKTPLRLNTPYVRDICLPLILKNRKNTPYGWQLIQGGFTQSFSRPGDAPQELRAWGVTTGPKVLCESMYRYHYKQEISKYGAFCGRRDVYPLVKGSPYTIVLKSVEQKEKDNDLCQTHGSSLSFALGSVWYLGSMVGMMPGRQRGRCSHKSFYVFVNTLADLEWMEISNDCSPNFACLDSTCISRDKVCDGQADCKDKSDEEPSLCSSLNHCLSKSKSHSCGLNGKCISTDDLCNGVKDCDNGSDENAKVCEKAKAHNRTNAAREFQRGSGSCSPWKLSKGVVPSCWDEKEDPISCTASSAPGSVIRLACDKAHRSRFSYDAVEMVCNKGRWQESKIFICDSICGVVPSASNPGFPWHASILVLEGGEPRKICSGTVIERSFLLTAHQCMTPWLRNSVAPKNFFVIVTPTQHSETTSNVKLGGSQVYTIKNVWANQNDSSQGLALVELKSSVRTQGDNLPVPACYILPPFNVPTPGQIGKITGFGIRGGLSNSPQMVDVKVVASEICASAGLDVFQEEFCVQVVEGNFPCLGDVGGGAFFQQGQIYVLKGVVRSEAGKCDSKLGVLTNVDGHSDWIMDILESHS